MAFLPTEAERLQQMTVEDAYALIGSKATERGLAKLRDGAVPSDLSDTECWAAILALRLRAEATG